MNYIKEFCRILTNRLELCEQLANASSNVVARSLCVEYYQGSGHVQKHWLSWNNAKNCAENDGSWTPLYNYLENYLPRSSTLVQLQVSSSLYDDDDGSKSTLCISSVKQTTKTKNANNETIISWMDPASAGVHVVFIFVALFFPVQFVLVSDRGRKRSNGD